MSTFIDAVNQVLRREGIIRGDNDNLTTFTDTTHNATSQLAQIAVQDEITELVSRGLLNYQHKTSTITLATGTRSYSLAADFIQMFGDPPFFYDSTNNIEIYEYPGGENALRLNYYDYLTTQGGPNYWYMEKATTKQVSFFQLPNSGFNGRVLNYDYMADVNVTNSTDTVPTQNTDEFNTFCGMAAIRFRYMYRNVVDRPVTEDPSYKSYRSTFFNLTRNKKPSSRYGSVFINPIP